MLCDLMILAVAVTITGLYHSQQKNEKAREFQKKIYFCFIDYANEASLDSIGLDGNEGALAVGHGPGDRQVEG